MTLKLIGIQNFDFIVEETGERILGSKLHVASIVPENDEHMNGCRVDAIWTKLDLSHVKPGDLIDLVYEQRLGSKKSVLSAVKLIPPAPSIKG